MCDECGFSKCPDGCPNAPAQQTLCPECGQQVEIYLYIDRATGTVVGCDQCIERKVVE